MVHDEVRSDPLKGLIAGLAGGFVGTLAMTAAQTLLSKLTETPPGEGAGNEHELVGDSHKNKPATEKAAAAVAEKVFHHTMTEQQEHIAGQAVHYGFGTVMGGLYGVTCEYLDEDMLLGGIPFGAAVMIGADEAVIPAVQLGPPPWKTPASTHIYSLVAHLVYGVTTELARRNLRAMI